MMRKGFASTAVLFAAAAAPLLAGSRGAAAPCKDREPPRASCDVVPENSWPPNHKLRTIGTATATDDCDPDPVVTAAFYSNEDDLNPEGSGSFSPDARFADPDLQVRVERSGNGGGRVYLVIVTATDSAGKIGWDCCTAVVSHDRSQASVAGVKAQAAAAQKTCEKTADAPPGYSVVGDGPAAGPKQ